MTAPSQLTGPDSSESARATFTARDRQLHQLAEDVRETERNRIAAELHDDVGQNLALVRMQLSQLEQVVPDEQKELLHATVELVRQTITSTRNLMSELNPPPVDELGFWPAIDWLAHRVSGQSGIEVVCENHCPDMTVEIETGTVLYRVVRELLHNCVKHSQSGQAVVRQFAEGDQLVLQIEDNGVGFEPPQSWASTASLGLFLTSERVKSLHGTLQIDSAPGHGARVTISVPLDECVAESGD